MNYFFTFFRLELRHAFCTPAKLLCTGCLLLMTGIFSAFLPPDVPASLNVGIFPDGALAEDAFAILQENEDYTITRYDSADRLERDVLSGVLHCGYELRKPDQDEKAVTAYTTSASYLHPLLDQLVLSAFFEARLPDMTAESFAKYGFDDSKADGALKEQQKQANPMTIELRTLGKASPMPAGTAQSMQPLLYAVLISLFFMIAFLQTILITRQRMHSQKQLIALSGHPLGSILAPVCAEVFFGVVTLLVCDLLLGVLLEGRLSYSPLARYSLFPFLAVGAALLSMLARPLRQYRTLILIGLPPGLFFSVFFSGALFSPEILPFGLAILRFFSPAWYGLHWMALF